MQKQVSRPAQPKNIPGWNQPLWSETVILNEAALMFPINKNSFQIFL